MKYILSLVFMLLLITSCSDSDASTFAGSWDSVLIEFPEAILNNEFKIELVDEVNDGTDNIINADFSSTSFQQLAINGHLNLELTSLIDPSIKFDAYVSVAGYYVWHEDEDGRLEIIENSINRVDNSYENGVLSFDLPVNLTPENSELTEEIDFQIKVSFDKI